MDTENPLSDLPGVPKQPAGSGRPDKRCFDSSDLFGSKREILIRHQGQEYRLLITRTEKLILNK